MLATSTTAMTEQNATLTLAGGRTLSYATFGDAGDPAVVVLDGPGSRGVARALAPAAAAVGVRLIAPDRPGFARSTADPGRAITDWSADHAALLDALGIERAGIIAQSGGTPYGLAAAAALPARTTALALFGAVSPLHERGALEGVAGPMRTVFILARRSPWLLRRMLRLAARQTLKDPDKAARKMAADAPSADRAVLEDPKMHALNAGALKEIFAHPDQFAAEAVLLARDWGIDLGAVTCPVAFWSGSEDVTHPTAMSRRLAERLGDPPIHVVPDAGTFGLLPHYPEALRFAAG
jgi:pimeloyl-ACP methyl ester carboxylesterase